MKYFLLLVAFAATFISVQGAAGQCYECEYFAHLEDYQTQKECFNEKADLPAKFLKKCSEINPDIKDWQCVKKRGKITVTVEKDGKEKDEDFNYVKRYCQPHNLFNDNNCKESDALDTQYGRAKKGFKCFCDTNDCNSASQLGTGIVSLIVVFFTVVFHRM